MAIAQVEKTLEHTDPLPVDRGILEGCWNQHAAELQGIAKDMDWLNECIDMRTITLQRLINDANNQLEKSSLPEAKVEFTGISGEKGVEGANENGHTVKSNANGAKISINMKRKTSAGSRKGAEEGATSMLVKEMESRISAFKKLKKSLAKSAMWQLDEMWRVEKAMGKTPGSWGKAGSREAEEGYVVADRKWSKQT